MEIRILGPLEVERNGRRIALGPKQQALLAVLVLEQGRVVSADRILEALYTGRPPQNALKTLHVHGSRLRKALGDGTLETTPAGYRLSTDGVEVDARRFEGLAEDGLLSCCGEQRRRRVCLPTRSRCAGSPLADFSYADFAQAEIARPAERRLAALEDRIEADLALGLHAALVGELEGSCASIRSERLTVLMPALYRSTASGRLAAFQRARTSLVESSAPERSPRSRATDPAPGLVPTCHKRLERAEGCHRRRVRTSRRAMSRKTVTALTAAIQRPTRGSLLDAEA
jgi:DNA-binding SARP family transcriptional activator